MRASQEVNLTDSLSGNSSGQSVGGQRLMKTHSQLIEYIYIKNKKKKLYMYTHTHAPKTFAINAANIAHQIGTLLVNKREAHDLQHFPESAYNLFALPCNRQRCRLREIVVL